MKWIGVVTHGSEMETCWSWSCTSEVVRVLGSTVLVQCKGFVLVLGWCIGVVLAVFDVGSSGRLVLGRGTSGSRLKPIFEDGHCDGRGLHGVPSGVVTRRVCSTRELGLSVPWEECNAKPRRNIAKDGCKTFKPSGPGFRLMMVIIWLVVQFVGGEWLRKEITSKPVGQGLIQTHRKLRSSSNAYRNP